MTQIREVSLPKNDFTMVEIFGIFDIKGNKFDIPFFAHNELFAKRRFMMMAKEEGILSNFLNDFQLCKLGSFNIVNGSIESDFQIVLEGKQIRKEIEANEISDET